jgi:two-component system cell cycle sensor histidine kinase/response regulator CckA
MLQAAVPFEVVLETDLPSPGPTISADANQIQQVLTNLCANAWEAAGDGRGGVHLIVKVVPAADIPAALRFPLDWQPQETTYACLEVADTGCGIAGPDIEKLFDPFYSTKFAGRGMGLSAVLGIVRTHGGVITVQSEPGHGSIFRVFFPVSAEAVPRPPEKAVDTPEAKGHGAAGRRHGHDAQYDQEHARIPWFFGARSAGWSRGAGGVPATPRRNPLCAL